MNSRLSESAQAISTWNLTTPVCNDTLSQDYVECNKKYTIHFPPGACGWDSKLKIDKKYEKIIIHTCDTWGKLDFDTSLWHGYENGTKICENFDDQGQCPRSSQREYASRDGFCVQSAPKQGEQIIGVDGQSFMHSIIDKNGGLYSA